MSQNIKANSILQTKFNNRAKPLNKKEKFIVEIGVWHQITLEQLQFIQPYIDASPSLISCINQFMYNTNADTCENKSKRWHSLSLKYAEKIEWGGRNSNTKNKNFEKTYFDCEWWLNIGLATSKRETEKYCRPFGGEIWGRFVELFGLEEDLAEIHLEDEECAKDKETLTRELEMLQQSQALFKIKEEQIKRKLNLQTPQPQKKIVLNTRESVLAKTIREASENGDFVEDEIIPDVSARQERLMGAISNSKIYAEPKIQRAQERFLERESKGESKNEISTESRRTKLFLKRQQEEMEENDEGNILNMD